MLLFAHLFLQLSFFLCGLWRKTRACNLETLPVCHVVSLGRPFAWQELKLKEQDKAFQAGTLPMNGGVMSHLLSELAVM